MKTMHAARHKWHGILSQHIDPAILDRKHHPCPMCGGKDRFRFIDHEGSGSWVCNQCTPKPRDGMALLMAFTGREFRDLAAEIDEYIGNMPADKPKPAYDASNRLAAISAGVQRDIRLTPVWKYLRSRGLNVVPENVGYHPALEYWHEGESLGKYPAMVARVQNVDMDRTTFHVTYLDDKGNKAPVPKPRKILSSPGSGSGVYLGKILSRMIVGEGLESTLAAMQVHSLPGVAAMNATNMARLILPIEVESVLIVSDADKHYTGQAAAFALAQRLYRVGIAVDVIVPEMGTDYADILAR